MVSLTAYPLPMNVGWFHLKSTGFTILEMLMVVSIAAVLMMVGIPTFEEFRHKQRMTASISLLHSQIIFARDQAIKLNTNVIACPGNLHSGCSQSNNWTDGWIVFGDLNNDQQFSELESLYRYEPALEEIMVVGNSGRQQLNFYGNGSAPGSNGSITFCDQRGPTKARKLVISNVGRIRRDQADDMNILNCP
jgi:type IV fimbrial biogenesis protein FimT